MPCANFSAYYSIYLLVRIAGTCVYDMQGMINIVSEFTTAIIHMQNGVPFETLVTPVEENAEVCI